MKYGTTGSSGSALNAIRASISSPRLRALLVATGAIATVLVVLVGTPRAAGTFAPTIKMETSTTRATSHPDARITIDNSASSENIKDLVLSLPDGFWGSLAAVPTKCTEVQAVAGTCPEGSRVGTVTATADIEDGDTTVNGVLSGGVYLTDAFTGNNDPAGISISVLAKVGGVDLGKVIVNGRVSAVYGATAGGAPSGSTGALKGLRTTVVDIPQSVTDTVNNRTVDYKLDEMQIDLISDLKDAGAGGYVPPLLTNPSVCGTYAVSASATPYGGGSSVAITDPYIVDQCSSSRFAPTTSMSFSDAVVPAGEIEGFETTVTNPVQNGQPFETSAIKAVTVKLPRSFGANYSSFGVSADMCTGSSASLVSGSPYWSPGLCSPTGLTGRPQAKVGELTLSTPLLPDPVKGDVYLINKIPLPWLGVNVSDSISGNPKGINFALVGTTDIAAIDSACGSNCGSQITATFSGLPDAPASQILLDMDQADRNKPGGGTLSGKILSMASADETCQPVADILSTFTGGNTSQVARVQTQSFADCNPAVVTPTSGPWGQETTSASPTFGFTYSGASPTLFCGVDAIGASPSCTGQTSFSASGLSTGAHVVAVGDGDDPSNGTGVGTIRGFVVQSGATSDTTVPTTTLNSVPATTPDTTPGFTFSASETSEFQCSLDGGAFLPCGSASGTADADYSIPASEELFASDETHTFAVRAQDTAGNVDLTPASASFKVVIPFAPSMSVSLTSTQARAHPELTLNISNRSHEDIKNYSLALPDGFFGGLTGVQSLCPVAAADAGTCGAGSKAGTVTATAVIDRSTVTTKGNVYLTEPRVLGDPAGLIIEVTPKIQDVTFNPIRVPARLKVRGQAQGIDSLVVDIPNTATSTIGEVSEFDMREISLQLSNNGLAPRPLLTNPSSCEAKQFAAAFTGYDATTGSYDVPFTATGCGSIPFGPALSITQVERATGGPPAASTNIRRAIVDLTATVSADPAGAGIKSVNLLMPQPLTVDVQRIPPPCMEEQANAKACPAASAIGSVSAVSPLLNEPLTGTVYVLKSSTSLPRLLIALRGRIDVDLIATNSFINPTTKPQILTQLSTLPDVPLTSFTMSINGFLTTRVNACDTGPSEWDITGGLNGFNGAASAVVIPLKFDCPEAYAPIFSTKYKPKGKKSTLSVNFKAQTGKKLKKLTLSLPKGVKFNKAGFTKKKLAKLVIVKGNGKKLKTKCFKLRSSTKFEINFCKKQVTSASVQFKAGTLNATSKKKTLKFKVSAVDSGNKSRKATLDD